MRPWESSESAAVGTDCPAIGKTAMMSSKNRPGLTATSHQRGRVRQRPNRYATSRRPVRPVVSPTTTRAAIIGPSVGNTGIAHDAQLMA
jgi:hypothetical protein